MDWIEISVDGRCWRGAAAAVDLAIPLDFQGPQPRFFAGAPASSVPLEAGSFTGEVRRGASCNCSLHTFAPHCHGTHTECVGHLTDDGHSLADHPPEPVRLALLLTLPPDTREISRTALTTAAERWEGLPWTALVVRTMPNDPRKRFRQYGGPAAAPWFLPEGIDWIVSHDVASLVVDLPSLDRGDDASLAAHHAYWGLSTGSRRAAEATRATALVTELAYIPDRLLDGLYLLELQIAPFASDAAPSRPVIRPANEVRV
jgi:kynurenine formamidase